MNKTEYVFIFFAVERPNDQTPGAEQLRTLTKSCLEENMSDTAAYYADKLVTFSGFDREAVLLLAKVGVTYVARYIMPAVANESVAAWFCSPCCHPTALLRSVVGGLAM